MPTTFLGRPSISSSITSFLESHAEFPDQHLLLALGVRDDDALAVHVLDAGGDERDRVPHQVSEGVPQHLVRRVGLGRPDQLRGRILFPEADRYRRPQVWQPPVLVAAIRTIWEARLDENVRGCGQASTGRRWCRARGRDAEVARQLE